MLELSVKNYRAVKNESLIIEGLVWITGPNSSGKSWLIKSIDAVMRNESGGDLIRIGEDSTEIKLRFPATETFPVLDIQWNKNLKGSGTYIINGKELVKTGRTTPQEILDSGLAFLRLRDTSFNLHMWDQATYFLVREPSTIIFQAVSKLLKHQAFLPMLRQIKVDIKEQKDNINDLGSQFKYLYQKAIDFETQLTYFKPFKTQRKLFDQLFQSQKDFEEYQQDLNFLNSVQSDITYQQNKVVSLKPILENVARIHNEVKVNIQDIAGYYEWLAELNVVKHQIVSVDQRLLDFSLESVPVIDPNQLQDLMVCREWLKELHVVEHQIDSVDPHLLELSLESIPVINTNQLQELVDLKKQVHEMNTLNHEELQCKTTLENIPTKIFERFDTLQAHYWAYISACGWLKELQDMQQMVNCETEHVDSVTKSLQEAQDERSIFYKENPLCPLCGGPWDGKDKDHE